MAHSTSARSAEKPSRKFSLWFHAGTQQWCKRIRNKRYYFGRDPDAALKRYLAEKDDLEAGRTPTQYPRDAFDLRHLCNNFLTHKKHQMETGEIAARTFEDYYNSCELMLKHLGRNSVVQELRPDDLMRYRRVLAKTRNATSLGNEVNRTRVILRYAFENMLIDRPVRFGDFKRPAKRVVRKQRAMAGPKLFAPESILAMLSAADSQLRAMILLGINGGMGNSDVGQLPAGAVDLEAAWLDFARPKTGIERRFPLWSETVEAIRESMANRRQPKDEQHAGLLFITRYGQPWHVDGKPRSP